VKNERGVKAESKSNLDLEFKVLYKVTFRIIHSCNFKDFQLKMKYDIFLFSKKNVGKFILTRIKSGIYVL